MYDAFKLRERSIIHSVEFNEVGPTLPHAVSLVRLRLNAEDQDFEGIPSLERLNKWVPDSSYNNADGSVTEALELQKVSGVARRMETHFSCR